MGQQQQQQEQAADVEAQQQQQAAAPPVAPAPAAAPGAEAGKADALPSTSSADGDPLPHAAHGGDAQAPVFDPPFARPAPPFAFWQDALVLLLLGGALGATAYAYLKAITEATTGWLAADGRGGYPDDPATLAFGSGRCVEPAAGGPALLLEQAGRRSARSIPGPSTLSRRAWWVGVTAGAGLAVGLVKAALGLGRPPSFITELQELPSDPAAGVLSLKVTCACLIGLVGGMPMG